MGKSKKKRAEKLSRLTVEEVQAEAQAARHRALLLRSLIAELDLPFGRDDVDFLRVGDTYEPPRRDAVQELRGELTLARGRAHARHRKLIRAVVDMDGIDEKPEPSLQ